MSRRQVRRRDDTDAPADGSAHQGAYASALDDDVGPASLARRSRAKPGRLTLKCRRVDTLGQAFAEVLVYRSRISMALMLRACFRAAFLLTMPRARDAQDMMRWLAHFNALCCLHDADEASLFCHAMLKGLCLAEALKGFS